MEDIDMEDPSDKSTEFGILDSIPADMSTYKSYTERYFTKRYVTNVNGIKNNDIMIMFHSNRIALLCLAPSHHFFNKKEDYTVNFNIGKVNRRNNTVKGKGKKGGQMLMPNSVVCKVEYKDGTRFDVPCCMKAKLIEVNEVLVTSPEVLREMPDADGFIAVLLATIEISDFNKKEMMTPEKYLSSLNREAVNNKDVANKDDSADKDAANKDDSADKDVPNKDDSADKDVPNKDDLADKDVANEDDLADKDVANKDDSAYKDVAIKGDTVKKDSINQDADVSKEAVNE